MFKEETLQKTGKRTYEKPDGEFLELIDSGSNTISVLTRIDAEKAEDGDEETLPFEPSGFTVSELKDKLQGRDDPLTEPEFNALLAAEKDGKDRATALSAIEDYQ
jgi:hypothetical protein